MFKLYGDASSLECSFWSDAAVLEKLWCVYGTLEAKTTSQYMRNFAGSLTFYLPQLR